MKKISTEPPNQAPYVQKMANLCQKSPKQTNDKNLVDGCKRRSSSMVPIVVTPTICRTPSYFEMPAPSNPTARMWRETCPDQLLPLVDALMICSRKVQHPFILRATQRLNKCYPACNYTGNLRDTALHLVSLVARNRHYLSIIKWVCPVCKTDNKATTTCSFCPPDPFKNSPF